MPIRTTAGEAFGEAGLTGIGAALSFLQFKSLGSGDLMQEKLGVALNPMVWPLAARYYSGNDPMAETHAANAMNRMNAATFQEQNDFMNWVKQMNNRGQSVGPDAVTMARDQFDSQLQYTLTNHETPGGNRLSPDEYDRLYKAVVSTPGGWEKMRNQCLGNEPGRSGH